MSGRLGLGVVLLAAGALWLLSATDVVDIPYGVSIGLLLVLVGLVTMLASSGRVPLVLAGIVLVLAGIPALFVDPAVWTEGIGEDTATPASAAELEPFRHGIGKLTVDLRTADPPLDGVTIEASLGIGELVVLVPADTDVSVDAHAGVGNVEALGETKSGVDVELTGISGTSGAQELDLELDVGVGNLRVERGD
jgi:hypothetical protein